VVIAAPPTAPALALALTRAAAWLETVRVAPQARPAGGDVQRGGYGGPVVHWWRDSLRYCGPGFDWRYEGLILGYLTLSRRAQGAQGAGWLERARRAGDDLLAAQLPGATFRCSGFEVNPVTAGTPHEAAADIGLLALAAALRSGGDPGWTAYLDGARRNLTRFYVGRLWDESTARFADDEAHTTFVPNKAATVAEALFRLADLTGDDVWVQRYARPTLDAVLRLQLRRPGHPLDGGIAQNRLGRTTVEKYFPYYVARCIPALLEAGRRFGDGRYRDGAHAAGAFLLRWRDPDGAFPQVLYPGGRANRFPRWVAGLGDVLRALELLQADGLPDPGPRDGRPVRSWLLDRQHASGAFRTAEGFASLVSQRPPAALPDARDLLPVAGWTDKAFRYLAGAPDLGDVPGAPPGPPDGTPPGAAPLPVTEVPCRFWGRPALYREDGSRVEVTRGREVFYRWIKGETWAYLR
jgi:hypothetical protein